MADHVTIKPQSESASAGNPEIAGAHSVGLNLGHIVTLCSLGLIASFFLPWVNILFGTISGFDLQKTADSQKLLWLIPVFAAITVVGGITGKDQRAAALITGVLPFVALAFWLTQAGSDLMHMLSYGAYLSLGFGLTLIVLPLRMK